MSPVGVNPSCFFRRRLDPTNQAEFFKTCFGFYWCPDCSWCIGSTRRPQHRRTMCLLFWWGCSQHFTTQKRKQWGLPVIRAATMTTFFSEKWSLAPREGDSKNLVAQRFAPAMWHNCFSTNWGHLFFVFDRHGKNTCFNTYSICELQAMTRKPRLVIDWACGRLLFRSLEEPDSLESVFGSLHGWGKLRFWMVLNFADLRWFEGGTAFDHQM